MLSYAGGGKQFRFCGIGLVCGPWRADVRYPLLAAKEQYLQGIM